MIKNTINKDKIRKQAINDYKKNKNFCHRYPVFSKEAVIYDEQVSLIIELKKLSWGLYDYE